MEVCDILRSGGYQVVILGKIIMATRLRLLNVEELIDPMEVEPESVELVFTGRRANPLLIERADLVTEMCEVKHYYQQGVLAREGIKKQPQATVSPPAPRRRSPRSGISRGAALPEPRRGSLR